jgi:hypothetical protein
MFSGKRLNKRARRFPFPSSKSQITGTRRACDDLHSSSTLFTSRWLVVFRHPSQQHQMMAAAAAAFVKQMKLLSHAGIRFSGAGCCTRGRRPPIISFHF